MTIVVTVLTVAIVFYLIGVLVHRGEKSISPLTFLKVVANFALTLMGSAMVIATVGAIGLFSMGVLAALFDSVTEEQLLETITGSGVLITIFLLVFTSAILQFLIREKAIDFHLLFRFNDDEYVLTEYLIQWSTIFLAIYQFVFQGIADSAAMLLHPESKEQLVHAVLNPENINLTIQPLLMCSWIAIVMEKLRYRSKLGVHSPDAPDHSLLHHKDKA